MDVLKYGKCDRQNLKQRSLGLKQRAAWCGALLSWQILMSIKVLWVGWNGMLLGKKV